MPSLLSPIPDARFGPAQARHLLCRVAFGPDRVRAARLSELGVHQAVETVLAGADTSGLPEPPVDPDVRRPFTREEQQAYRQAINSEDPELRKKAREARQAFDRKDRQMIRDLQPWWLERMMLTPDPTQEFATLFWHGHFATGYQPVRDAYLMWRQNEALRRYSLDSFATLARYIVHDPAMIKYLNNHQNRRGKPNENLARELMELFTLGEGMYRESDIKEGARALTGYTFSDNDFSFNERQHDDGSKTILGKRGKFDGEDFVGILLKQRACARYIALKLYRHYVADVSDRYEDLEGSAKLVVDQVARVLRSNKYAIRPTLRTLLASDHFYSDAVVGRKIKSPAQLVVGTARSMRTPKRSMVRQHEGMRVMGQTLFEPPSVAGWGVGRSWINTSTLYARQNTCVYMLTGKSPGRKWNKKGVNYDPMRLITDLDKGDPRGVANVLIDEQLGPGLPAERRVPLIDFLAEGDKAITRDRLLGFLTLVTAMPEYQLC
ncbi:DUF1800 domain-containing protein [Mucisphaera calidilacus]|uniref:DUF1800 domain-containing protein n=1 Tax=Mucisphaera calidilacus TaxID=2527982 RepID=A0A518BT92_9BACT|nr:DUF1800 domain-containing protein [Mucisphaera calidilacus]QDU70187.1 hypothetical protein Pan265_00090 [Mucisphaera calidilacus]